MRDGDEVFDHRGAHILLSDGVALVDDLVRDVVETDTGKRLLLRHAHPTSGL